MPIKRPPADIPGYMELRKQFNGDAAPAAPETPRKSALRMPSPAPERPAKPLAKAAPKPAPKRSADPGSESVMVKGSAAVPVQGHDPVFDAAVETYGMTDAVRIFVDRGLSEYVAAVRAGRASALAPAYPRRSRSVQLARAIPADVVETISAWADPIGILKPSKTAGIILSQIMAWQIGRKG